MSKASGNGSSIYKPLTILLFIAVVGVIALYSWYTERLNLEIAQRGDEVTAGEQNLTQANKRIGLLGATEQRLRTEIDKLKSQHQTTTTRLRQQIDSLEQSNQGLIADMETQRRSHAESLAAEQRNTAGSVAAEQQKALDNTAKFWRKIDRLIASNEALNADIATLTTEREQDAAHYDQMISGLNQELAEAKAARDAAVENAGKAVASQSAVREKSPTESEGAEAEHAAQLLERDKDLQASRTELAGLQRQLSELQAEHAATKQRLAEALEGTREQSRTASSEHKAAQDAATALLQQTRDQAAASLSQAQAEHRSAIDEANGRIAALRDELSREQAALTGLRQEYDDLTTRLTASETSLSDVRDELAAAIASAASTRSTLEAGIAAAESRTAELEQDLIHERQLAARERQASELARQQALTQVREMFQAFDQIGARQTEQGMLVQLDEKEVNFRLGQSALRTDKLPSLDRLAAVLNKFPALKARVEGHTDNSGRDETNLKLSQERAETVANALIQRGIDSGRLIAEGFGEARPIGNNATKYGRFQNRRVEIYISGP